MANIIIVGGGVAGLSAGIYARLNGHNATIYERHFKAGGNLTGWDRQGYHIDNCIHWLTGTNPNTDLYKTWKELGVLGNVDIYYGDSLYTFDKEGERISLYSDLNKLEEEMLRISIEDKKEIKSFIKAIKIVQGLSGIKGKNNDENSSLFDKIKSIPTLLKYYNLSTGELALRFKHPLLQEFIVSLMSEYFSALALIVVFATFTGKNGGIPVGSSCAMAKRMEERFLSLGGKLVLNKGVKKINVIGNKARSITLDDGLVVNADYVIASGDPAIIFSELLDKKLMPNDLKKYYNDPRMLRFSCYHCAFSCDNNLPFNGDIIFEIPDEYKKSLNTKYLIIREFSHEKSFAPDGKNLLLTMTFCKEEDCNEFIKLSKDKGLYKQRKEKIANEIKEIIENKFSELKGKLNCIDVFTPATYKRYTSSEIGSFMSFVLPSKTLPKKLSNRIKGVDNVILASQWLQAPGGLPIAAGVGKDAINTIMKLEKATVRELKKSFS